MGNIVDTVSTRKSSLLLIGAIGAALYGLHLEAKRKDNITALLRQALQAKQLGVKQFENALNQVYLKDHVQQNSIRNNAEHPIYKVAITGGPCAGKSTALARIRQDLISRGFRVFSVLQVPTLIVQSGGMILMSRFSIQERIKFQSLLIRFQMYIEDYFTRLAQMSKTPAVVLCDRGTVDPAAYVSKEEFQAILDEQGWSWVTLRDRRYDRVIFLSSAANGAEEFYKLDNQGVRHESVSLARNVDKRTLDVWTGHPHITVCPNIPGESFDQKLERAVRSVQKTVGLQLESNRYQKFLLQKPQFPFELKVELSEIEEVFLLKGDDRWTEDKIKRRGQNGSFTYQRKYRGCQDKNGDYCQEIRKPLTSMQYVLLKEERRDKDYKAVVRQRYHFIHNGLPYSIDVYDNIHGQEKTYILRFANLNGQEARSLIPSFLVATEDVRLDARYTLHSIARIQ